MNQACSISRFTKRAIIIVLTLTVSSIVGLEAELKAASKATIEPYVNVDLDKNEIYLGSVAKIRGADRDLVKRLHGIFIGKAPLPGETRRIDTKYMLLRIRQGNIDPSRVDIADHGEVTVRRRSVTIGRQAVEEAITNFIHRKMPWDKGQAKITKLHFNQAIALPPGKVSLKIAPPKSCDYLGNVPLSVSIFVDGQFEKRIWVTAQIKVQGEVVVVRKPLGRYQRIAQDDLLLKTMDLSQIPPDAIRQIASVVGKRTTRSVFPKAVLREALVESPPVLKRGDLVTILAESQGLKITTQGLTKEKGRPGERIRVLNIDSKKMIYARVLDGGTVKVDF